MKRIYTTAIAFMATMALLCACSGDDSENVDNTPAGAYVKAKIEGVQFETVTVQGLTSVYASRTGTGAETNIIVVGTDLDMNVVGFTAYGITTTGTYELNEQTAVMLFTDPSEITYDTNECEGATGTLTITHIDDVKVEGTFEFIGKKEEDCSQSKTITEGSFRGIFVTE